MIDNSELILEMHRDIKGTLNIHGKKIDKIMELSSRNDFEIDEIKKDIISINSNQNDFIKKPDSSSFKFWFKIGSLVSAFIIAIYQTLIK